MATERASRRCIITKTISSARICEDKLKSQGRGGGNYLLLDGGPYKGLELSFIGEGGSNGIRSGILICCINKRVLGTLLAGRVSQSRGWPDFRPNREKSP